MTTRFRWPTLFTVRKRRRRGVIGEYSFAGCALRYWLDGPDGAPVVVFTPGAFVDHALFEPQVAAVCRSYRMLRWDVRGHGASRPTTTPFSCAQAAEDLAALLDHLGLDRVALVGQSIGGNISQDFIFRYPQRCAAAVFLDCTCSTLPIGPLDRLLLAVTPAVIGLYPTDMFKRQITQTSAVTEAARDAVGRMVEDLAAGEVRAISRGIADAVHGESGYRIACPCLIAHGEHDRLGNIRKIAGRWARRDGAIGPVVIPRAGHVANLDNPDAFNDMLMAFLADAYPA